MKQILTILILTTLLSSCAEKKKYTMYIDYQLGKIEVEMEAENDTVAYTLGAGTFYELQYNMPTAEYKSFRIVGDYGYIVLDDSLRHDIERQAIRDAKN